MVCGYCVEVRKTCMGYKQKYSLRIHVNCYMDDNFIYGIMFTNTIQKFRFNVNPVNIFKDAPFN